MDSLVQSLSLAITRFEKNNGSKKASIIYACISTLSATSVILYTKLALSSVDVIQIQVWRGIIMACLYAILAKAHGVCLAVTDSKLKRLTFVQNFWAAIMSISVFFLLSKLPASIVGVVQMITPLFIGYLDHVMYKTKYSIWEICCTLLAVIGVILIIDPNIIIFWENESLVATTSDASSGYTEGTEKLFWIALYIIVIGLFSYSLVIVRKLEEVPILTLNFGFGIILTPMASIAQILNGNATVIPPLTLLGIIIFLGTLSVVDQLSYTRAFQIGKQGTLSVLMNTFVVWLFLFEIFYLKEYPSIYALVGSFLIVCSSTKLTLSQGEPANVIEKSQE